MMDSIVTIADWWDGPKLGLTTFRNEFCVYEKEFSEALDDYTNLYWLTPVCEEDAQIMYSEWDRWCKFMSETPELVTTEWKSRIDETNIAKQSPRYHEWHVSAKLCIGRLENYHDRDMQLMVEWNIV